MKRTNMNTEELKPETNKSTKKKSKTVSGNKMNDSSQKLEIVVRRHEQLFELLANPNRLWKVLLLLMAIIIVFFLGLSIVVISIKKYYPYNAIETNIEGASIMKSEDKEVIYWLFNTADLWASSGIKVDDGDELTIRASGASFTAIHHLVEASDSNYMPIDKWVGTEGQEKTSNKDKLRAKYRINKNYDEGILLMMITNNNKSKLDESYSWMGRADEPHGDDEYIEVIGKERNNLKISKPGVLHFAVNDIVMTDDVLSKMYEEYIHDITKGTNIDSNSVKKIVENFNRIGEVAEYDSSSFKNDIKRILNNAGINDRDKDTIVSKINSGLALGRHPHMEDSLRFINELVYYKEHNFRNAWYVDNLGSFLIVIEKKNK